MRQWKWFWLIYVVSGFVADPIAYICFGRKATLTYFVRTSMKLEPNTKFARLARVLIGTFMLWAAIHLSFGIFDPVPFKMSADSRRKLPIDLQDSDL